MRKTGILRLGVPFIFIFVLAIALQATGMASSMEAVWPEASGTNVQTNGKLVIDASNMDLGYVMVRAAEASKHAFKIRVAYGKNQLAYDLNSNGEFETFPLQLGSGKYEIALFENVKGNKYSAEGKVNLDVHLVDENAAYLVPNQYVDYELWTSAVQKSDELCADAAPADAFKAVSNFIADEFQYDFARAKKGSSGQLPDIEFLAR